jgi:hypothetical protein
VRLIDADALKEKKVYSRERHEKIVPVAEIDWSPTIDAIPVEWLVNLKNEYAREGRGQAEGDLMNLLLMWQKEQEAR